MKTLTNPPTWKAVKMVFPEESFVERFKIWLVGKVLLPDFDGDELTEKGRQLKILSGRRRKGMNRADIGLLASMIALLVGYLLWAVGIHAGWW